MAGRPSAREILNRIRKESRDEVEKGRWFEQLFSRIALQDPAFEIDGIWRWNEWPEREQLTGLSGRDIGVDLVARRTDGEWVAIQCKCYDDDRILPKGEIDKFLGGSQHGIFHLRWVVATCRWGPNAESAIEGAHPRIGRIDFREYLDVQVEEEHARRPVQEPWELQAEAIEDMIDGLAEHDRGRLVMACGTGKTFTSLRIAEELVEDGGRILFAAPSIALVSQARREWLRQTIRPLECVVVCSDTTAGGRGEEDMRLSELECPVTTNPSEIADKLAGDGMTRVVFCTYQSLRRVTDAQALHGAPAFNLAIADEAHRTTGARLEGRNNAKKVDFQEIHDGMRLTACKRLYMTATPRIYTESSKRKLADRGVDVIDMGDIGIYGPELHRLPFKKAVEHDMLSDYRVIVLGVSQDSVTPGLRRRLEGLDAGTSRKNAPTANDMTRVLGVSLAVNGVTEGKEIDQPGKLSRSMAFANSIRRSNWYAQALMDSQVLSATTRRMQDGRAMRVVARHLDASASALERNRELRALARADREGECRIVCNVRLFTEGVDVPQLDAVAFLDPRDSQVDVVQAVGRVMRRAPGKRFGYIIVPVVVEPGQNVARALERGSEGYKTVGRVLRALQSHDSRLAETPANFIRVYEQTTRPPRDDTEGGAVTTGGPGDIQRELDLREAERGIYAHVAAASGLGRPGQLVADEITDAVRRASSVLQEEKLEEPLAGALGLVPEDDGGAKGVCTVAALMLCNACLLQRRLRDEPSMNLIMRLDKVAGARDPREVLNIAWESILEKDYAPVFEPGLAVLAALPDGNEAVDNAVKSIAECANRVADSLSDLGYDHAGPLYHRILGSAKSDGAFYTNNLSAIMLARLALTEDFADWSDADAIGRLRIMDPACGTGTLLMATLQAIKARYEASHEPEDGERDALHKRLVEDVLCGLDINRHAVQLAACNMTLGAPTVDYERMNLFTMLHGPQQDGDIKAGSLELLTATDDARSLQTLISPLRALETLDAGQVSAAEQTDFPLRDLDLAIMNAPFTANENRSRKYGEAGRKAMQDHELGIQQLVEQRDNEAEGVVTANSIGTFFTPLADLLLSDTRGTLAKVIPTTACTNTSGAKERRFLASRFHIDTVVTSHDPRRPNFSENTAIHESLLICRRRTRGDSVEELPTRFFSLRSMPSTPEEAVEAVEAIQTRDAGEWGTLYEQPAVRVREGDWRPCQFLDPELVTAALLLEQRDGVLPLERRYRLGPAGQRIRDAFLPAEGAHDNGYRVFWSRSKDLRTTMEAFPEQSVTDRKERLAARYRGQAGNILLPARFDTISGKLVAIFSEEMSLGSMWVPIQGQTTTLEEARALCAWFNSTVGMLGFMMRRGTKLTNPSFSQAELATLPVPDFRITDAGILAAAFGRVRLSPMMPLRNAAEDDLRDCLDRAAAETTGIDIETIRDWRRRIAAEPTVTNSRAEDHTGEERLTG